MDFTWHFDSFMIFEVAAYCVPMSCKHILVGIENDGVTQVEGWNNKAHNPHDLVTVKSCWLDHSECKCNHTTNARQQKVQIYSKRLRRTFSVEHKGHGITIWYYRPWVYQQN